MGCSKDGGKCISGAGKIVEKSMELNAFTFVEIHGRVNYVFKKDSIPHVVVSCGERLIEGVSVNQTQDKVIIKDNNTCRWLRNLSKLATVTIYGNNLSFVEDFSHATVSFEAGSQASIFTYNQRDAGSVCNLSFSGNELYVKLNTGIGTIKLTGKSDFLYTYNAAAGWIDGSELSAATGQIDSRGSNYTKVNVSDYLYVESRYIGKVYYQKDVKQIEVMNLGSGEVTPY